VLSQRTSWIHKGLSLNDLYLIVNAVEGLEPGAYAYHRDGHVLELPETRKLPRFRLVILGLDQQLPAEAAADIFFLANLQNDIGALRQSRIPGRAA